MNSLILVLILIISVILCLIGILTNIFNLVLIANSLLVLFNVTYSLKSIKKRIPFLFFNISFFTFLIGKNLLEMFCGKKWYTSFPQNIQMNTLCLLYVSLFSILIGNVICEATSKEKNYGININQLNPQKNKSIRFIINKLYIFVMFFAFIVALEKAIFVQNNTYIDLYTTYTGNLPSIFYKIASINSFIFCMYLATFPPKKNTYKIILSYLIYLCITLLIGARGAFVTGLFVIIIYLFIRQTHEPNNIWISKKMKFISIILAFFLVVFLGWYNTYRNGINSDLNVMELFLQFFDDQGGSVNLISYAEMYENKLPETNTNYTFSAFINLYKYGTIGKIINTKSYVDINNKMNMALYGNNLGATLSYIVLQNQYLKGHGIGTQYIAELYVDFGYIGVILYNIFIGYILTKIVYFNYNNVYKFGLLLYALFGIMFIPRNFATTWIVSTFFSVLNWLIIIFIYIVSNHIYKNNYKEGGNYEYIMDS